jgi:cell division protease FtsH
MPEKNNRKNNGRRPNPDDKFEWKKATKTVSFWILIFVAAILIAQAFDFGDRKEVSVTYTQYRELFAQNKIISGYVADKEFHGLYKTDPADDKSEAIHFHTTLPFIENWMLEEWDAKGIKYEFREKATNILGYFITGIFPWLLLIGAWIFVMRRLQGGGTRGVFSFGKSKAKLLTENHPKVTFADVAGADEAKEELEEIIEFLRDPKKFQRLGGKIPRGALLLGPPGTGKTLLAKAVAGEAGVPFFSMSGADFVEMFVGVGASRVRDLFETGKKNAPCIIFIDEIDAVGRHRGAGLGGGHDEREQTLNQLLVEMDGFESNEGVILIAATNRPDVLDPALMRPGRFDRQIVVDRPDVRGREGILKVHTRKIPLSDDVNLQVLAKGTPGLAGADLANLVNEAALMAARHNADRVTMTDMEHAKDKVMMGVERKSMLISDDEKRTTAYHEAGHVLVSKLVPGADPVHKVTIIPRGRALGLTHYLPIDEKHNYSKTYLEAILTHLLGGRAAEKLVFNQLTTGAGNDIERATEIARKMVCEWGMSEVLGPLTFGKKEEEIFLGREISKHRDYSEQTAIEIDREVRTIVSDAADRAQKILADNVDKLRRLAEVLLEREILDGEEIDRVLAGETLEQLVVPRHGVPEIAKPEEVAIPKIQKKVIPSGGSEPTPETA